MFGVWTNLCFPPTLSGCLLASACCLSKMHVPTCVFTGFKLGTAINPGVMVESPIKLTGALLWGFRQRLTWHWGASMVTPSTSSYALSPVLSDPKLLWWEAFFCPFCDYKSKLTDEDICSLLIAYVQLITSYSPFFWLHLEWGQSWEPWLFAVLNFCSVWLWLCLALAPASCPWGSASALSWG